MFLFYIFIVKCSSCAEYAEVSTQTYCSPPPVSPEEILRQEEEVLKLFNADDEASDSDNGSGDSGLDTDCDSELDELYHLM